MKIHEIFVPSKCLERDVPVNIFVPDAPSGKWLLLLHGYGGDENEWIKKTNIIDLAQKFGVVLCAPSCGNNYYYLDVQESMGCFLGEELPAFMYANFPVSSNQKDASIAGSSMGGFGAVLLGSRYSNIYGKIASFGGAFIIHDIAIGNPAIVRGADINYFRRVFGDFSTLEGSERDPLSHIQKAVSENRMSSIWLLCGVEDVLYRSNEKMYEEISRLGVPIKLIGVSGGHNWPTWTPYMDEMMEWLTNLS